MTRGSARRSGARAERSLPRRKPAVRSFALFSLRNLPNVITCARLVLTGIFLWLLSYEGKISSYLALLTFSLASFTDWLDGHLARRYGLSTPFGIFMDPFADKVMVLSALVVFVWQNLVQWWMVVVIASREFLITSIRMLAENKGISLAAMPSGKQKTVVQIVAIIGILIVVCVQYTISDRAGLPYDTALSRMGARGATMAKVIHWLPNTLLFVATVFSVASGIDFVVKHRKLFRS